MLQVKVLRAEIGITARPYPEVANRRAKEVESQDLELIG